MGLPGVKPNSRDIQIFKADNIGELINKIVKYLRMYVTTDK